MASRPLAQWLGIICIAFALASCGGGDDDSAAAPNPPAPPPPPPPPPPVVPTLTTQRVFASLSVTNIVSVVRAPSDTSRRFVLQQEGRVLAFENRADVSTTTTALDIVSRVFVDHAGGLLGMAFHPGWPADPRVFLAYTTAGAGGTASLRISEFRTTNSGTSIDATTEQIVFEIPQTGGHNNGGHVLFGPDGFLYLGIGDGGNDDSGGQVGEGQTLTNLLGKVLRIDVDGQANGRRYRIPTDNPFPGNAMATVAGTCTGSCPELYAWGFRNPWRFSFDRQGGDLWLADVGSHDREEVDKVIKGGNYGWRCLEGTRNTGFTCGSTPLSEMIAPVAEYTHANGAAIVGGFVYRGTAMPGLAGRFLFADYGSGQLWNIANDTAPTRLMTGPDGIATGHAVASIFDDEAGEQYIADRNTGGIFKIVARP